MRPVTSFTHLMPDTITYAVACSTGDAYGHLGYATATLYRARVVGEQKLVRSFEGREVISAHTVYVAGAIVVQPRDQITLSTAVVASTQDSAIHPPLLGAKRVPDQSGVHHTVVYLG